MRSSGILLAFFIIPPRHVGPCMQSPRRNTLPKLSPIARAPLSQHTLEFKIITNSQHLKLGSFSCARTTLNIVSRACIISASTNSLLTKIDLQSRPCGISSLTLTSLVWSSFSLKMWAFNSRRKSALYQFASSTYLLLPLTSLMWTF